MVANLTVGFLGSSMPENRQVQSNAVPNASNSSPDHIDEAIRRLNIQSNDNQEEVYPERPGEPDCIYYLRTGLCGYGSNCRFNHPVYTGQGVQYSSELPERAGQPDCGYFLKTGTCKYGFTCKYHHPRDRKGAGQVLLNIVGLPMRQDEKPCPYYMRTGSCKFGAACKFHHPQPASPGNVLPVTGPPFVSTGSSIGPSSSLPFVGALPAWSFPRAPYLSGPRVPGQAYIPVVLSPPPAILPAQGWSTYMGNIGSLSSTSILGSSLLYNSKQQGESSLISSFPERPGQPECRYFMNTGTCKYGSDCKFHHPRERITQSATNSLGLGLPRRPGCAICSYYSMYGICKFGPTCKFDHPDYSYNYGSSVPSLSILNPSVFPYQRNSPMIESFENSPSKSSNSDWVKKSEISLIIHESSDSNDPENSSEHAMPPPHDSSPSSENMRSHSD